MIYDASILATLKQGMPTFHTKLDTDKMEEFAERHNADKTAVGGSVAYVPKTLTAPVSAAYWAAKNGFRNTVLPFPSELAGASTGLVTSAFFPELARMVRKWEADWNNAVQVLCAAWPDVLRWQQQQLGDLWDEQKHAVSEENIRSRCKFVFTVKPVPSGDALPQAFQQMAEALDAQVQTAMEEAQHSLMEKFLGEFRKLAEQLADEGATFNKKSRGDKSPREKFREFVKQLPDMSLVKDERLNELVQDILRSDAMMVPTEVLRTDLDKREDAALDAFEQVRRIEQLMQGV